MLEMYLFYLGVYGKFSWSVISSFGCFYRNCLDELIRSVYALLSVGTYHYRHYERVMLQGCILNSTVTRAVLEIVHSMKNRRAKNSTLHIFTPSSTVTYIFALIWAFDDSIHIEQSVMITVHDITRIWPVLTCLPRMIVGVGYSSKCCLCCWLLWPPRLCAVWPRRVLLSGDRRPDPQGNTRGKVRVTVEIFLTSTW